MHKLSGAHHKARDFALPEGIHFIADIDIDEVSSSHMKKREHKHKHERNEAKHHQHNREAIKETAKQQFQFPLAHAIDLSPSMTSFATSGATQSSSGLTYGILSPEHPVFTEAADGDEVLEALRVQYPHEYHCTSTIEQFCFLR